jgi:hypothetical protein
MPGGLYVLAKDEAIELIRRGRAKMAKDQNEI